MSSDLLFGYDYDVCSPEAPCDGCKTHSRPAPAPVDLDAAVLDAAETHYDQCSFRATCIVCIAVRRRRLSRCQ